MRARGTGDIKPGISREPEVWKTGAKMNGLNAIFAFIVKAILIFLSIVGYCNLWFAIFIDIAASLATILNSIRVTKESLIDILLYKTGRK